MRARTHGKHERVAGRRAFAVLAGVLVLVTQASGLGHALLVKHTICPEHGELIHVDDESAHRVGHAAQSAETTGAVPGHKPQGSETQGSETQGAETREGETHEAVTGGAAIDDGHESCTLLAERPKQLLPRPVPSGLVTLDRARLPHLATSATSPAPQVPLLMLAPKSSPTF